MSASFFRDIKGRSGLASGQLSQLIVFGTFERFDTTLSQQEQEVGGQTDLSFFFLDNSVMQDEMAHTEDKT